MTNRQSSAGFTVLEMTIVVTIIGILAAIAVPVYKEYNSRAYAADMMVQYDAIRQKTVTTASEYYKDVCHWEFTWDGTNLDPATEEIAQIVKEGFSQLPAGWHYSGNGLLKQTGSTTDVALIVTYLAMGNEAAINQARELARMFQKNGMFREWIRDLDTLAYFSVYLDDCSNVKNTASAGAATNIQSQPVQPNPQPQPLPSQPQQPAQPAQPNPQPAQPNPQPQPTQPQQPSPADQAQQCRDNCRAIYPHGNSIHYRNCVASCG